MNKTLLIALLTCAACAQAEVYRWTDASGKVHFSDSKANASAQNITQNIKQVNVDTSTGEQQKMAQLFRKENNADREFAQRKPEVSPQQIAHCERLKERLRKISGNIIFLDDKGKVVNVNEAERTRMVADLSHYIRDNCPE